MEIARKDFNRKIGEKVNIYFLGDIHEGNCNHAAAELREAVKIIKNDPDGYVIGMGDYIEAINAKDPRFNPAEMYEDYKLKDLKDIARKQANNVYDKLEPIEDRFLALLIGNHEEAYMKHSSFDVYDHLRRRFNTSAHKPGHAPPKLGYVGFYKIGLFLPGGKETYTISIGLNHGIGGGGTKPGYAINKVHECFEWWDADICVMAHIHALAEDSEKIQRIGKGDELDKRQRYWGVSGSFLWTFLEGNTNYFEHKGKSESDIGMLKAEITQMHSRNGSPKIELFKIKLG